MSRAAHHRPLLSFLIALSHQVAVHSSELAPESVLEFIQFAVKGEILGL